ncbi:unnamed protein product [Chrysodeixis includens]|uniref:Uncharacterized protein n=1 Tax=Chrysodeixis includens TaxID=689277 RepID=A0A9N8KY57_CHRIL|nr:unnamed protein product [Chrysodeixis includens]
MQLCKVRSYIPDACSMKMRSSQLSRFGYRKELSSEQFYGESGARIRSPLIQEYILHNFEVVFEVFCGVCNKICFYPRRNAFSFKNFGGGFAVAASSGDSHLLEVRSLVVPSSWTTQIQLSLALNTCDPKLILGYKATHTIAAEHQFGLLEYTATLQEI